MAVMNTGNLPDVIRSHPRLTAAIAGLLVASGLPPWGWWPLSLIGIGAWFSIIEGRSARQRFWLSVL
ncbi:MAG: hypothetical protein EBY44_07310, partial [Actinobacteria bacterium]|nr:hypothetical protein [Actinomycetota bacterium]